MKPDDPRHGTQNGYGNLECRCDPCKEAHAEYTRSARDRRHAALLAGEAKPPHGDVSTYANYLCRCQPCRDAHADGRRDQERKRKARVKV